MVEWWSGCDQIRARLEDNDDGEPCRLLDGEQFLLARRDTYEISIA